MSAGLGPSRAFAHVSLGPSGESRFEGTPSWEGGTRVTEGRDELGGVFGGWRWDGSQLLVHTDRLGLFPLFIWAGTHGCCVSPSIAVLLERGAPRDLDLDAIAIFLRLGYFLGEDTPFRAVCAVPAVRSSSWCAGVMSTDPWPRVVCDHTVTRAAAIDEYVERFRLAIERRLPAPDEEFALPLSGGADSRHILFELVRGGRRPRVAVTATQRPGANDVEVARHLSARLGIDHVRVRGPMDAGWTPELRKNRLTSFCADEHVWYPPVAERIATCSDLTYDGLLGDILSAQVDLTEPVLRGMRAGRIDELLADVLAESHEEGLADALRPAFLERIPRDAVRDRVAAELEPVLDHPNPWAAFFLRHWERREITLNPHSILGRLRVHTPFVDGDLVRFLSSLPAELLIGGRFHIDTIRRAFPEHADIAFARDLPRSRVLHVVDRARRIPPRLGTQIGLAARSQHSEILAKSPPVLRRPAPGRLGALNRRLLWVRQVELVARGELAP